MERPFADAGWYPDPGGSSQPRWWDGRRWTDHVAPSPDWLPGAEPTIAAEQPQANGADDGSHVVRRLTCPKGIFSAHQFDAALVPGYNELVCPQCGTKVLVAALLTVRNNTSRRDGSLRRHQIELEAPGGQRVLFTCWTQYELVARSGHECSISYASRVFGTVPRNIHNHTLGIYTQLARGDTAPLGIAAQPPALARERSGGVVRERIPQHVKDEVWRRDQGRCAECGSRNRLEFDHIVPVAKGGSSTARNIELLCESCNRSKGARLG